MISQISDFLRGTELEDNPALNASLFSVVEDAIGASGAEALKDPKKQEQALARIRIDLGRAFEKFVEFFRSGKGRELDEQLQKLKSRVFNFLGLDVETEGPERVTLPGEEGTSDGAAGPQETTDFDTNAGIDANADADNADFGADAGEARDEGAKQEADITRLTDDPQEQDDIRNFLRNPEAQRDLLRKVNKFFVKDEQFVVPVIAKENWTITTEEAVTVRHYTGGLLRRMNKRLREGKATPDDQNLAALLARSLEPLPSPKGEIWRAPRQTAKGGKAVWDSAVVGEPLAPDILGFQFQSFTTDKELASRWSRDAKLVVHAKSTPSGAFVEKLSVYPRQDEVLLPPGLRYIVLNKRTEGNLRIIEVEIVDAK